MKLSPSPAWSLTLTASATEARHLISGEGFGFAREVGEQLVEAFTRRAPWDECTKGLARADAWVLTRELVNRGALWPMGSRRAARAVAGTGRLAEALARLTPQRAGLRLPALHLEELPHQRAAGVALAPVLPGVLALATACATCLRLRVMGRFGQGGAVQPFAATPDAAAMPDPILDAIVFELLLAAHQRPLGADEALVFGARFPLRRAPVLTHPDCPHCRPSAPTAAQARAKLLAALAARARAARPGAHRALNDPTTGPLAITEQRGTQGQFPFEVPFVVGGLRLTRRLHGTPQCVSSFAGIYGKGTTAAQARRLAVSEGVERLMSLSAQPHRWGPQRALEGAVPLSALYSFATDDDAERPRAWVHALELSTRRVALLPFEAVAVRLPDGSYPQAVHREPYYSGAASHLTFSEAAVRAVVEVLERDAFIVGWYRKRALSRVWWPSRPSAIAKTRAAFLQKRGFGLELFDLRLELPLPMLLMRATSTRAHGNWPAGGAMLFASAGFTAHAALEHALGLACGQFLSFSMDARPEKNPLDPVAVERMHAQLPGWPLMCRHLNPANAHEHAFLGRGQLAFESIEGRAPRDARAALGTLSTWLSGVGLSAYLVRLTDATAEASGFEVAKGVVPGLLALAPRREDVDLGLPRLSRAWPNATCEAPNPDPHPMY